MYVMECMKWRCVCLETAVDLSSPQEAEGERRGNQDFSQLKILRGVGTPDGPT